MRKFDYRKDYGEISNTIFGYINQLEKELRILVTREENSLYGEMLEQVVSFKGKYSNFYDVQSMIGTDLLKPDNVEFCFKNRYYPKEASKIGLEFEQDLKKIVEMEYQLRELAAFAFQNRMTDFRDIVNGEDFMVVGHVSYNLPGTIDCPNYKSNAYQKQYLSCSLFTGRELNTFNGEKIIYLIDINKDNYISSSSFDSVTYDSSSPSFRCVKEIDIDGEIHYINVGYSNDRDKAVTLISTPELIEQLSIEREVQVTGEMFCYDGVLTNEVVVDRTKANVKGALLVSDGCDLLIDEYLNLKYYNVPFKCINKGLYREKNGITCYTDKEFNKFVDLLKWLEIIIEQGKLSPYALKEYYMEVVLPMHYSEEILDMIRTTFSKYVKLSEEIEDNLARKA